MKRLSYFTLICLSIIGVQANANAGVISLVDLNPGDAMSVTGQVQSGNILTVSQTYGDNKLIPFVNHNPIFPDAKNMAVVNQLLPDAAGPGANVQYPTIAYNLPTITHTKQTKS